MGRRIPRKAGQPAKSKKHSDLYTDEDPKGTIHGLGFKTPEKAKESVSKIKGSSRSHNHKTQAAISMEQRAKVMGKDKAANVYRKFIDAQKEKTKDMKEDIDQLDEAIPLALPLAGPAVGKVLGAGMTAVGAAGLARNIFRSDASSRSKAMRRGGRISPGEAQSRQARDDRRAAARERAAERSSSSPRTSPKPTTSPKPSKEKVNPALERSANEVLRRIRSEDYHPLDELLYDPLQDLWDLAEELNVLPKPDLSSPTPSSYESPFSGQSEHPVTQMRRQVDDLISQGIEPPDAHQQVHGPVDSSNIESKGKLAATLGRLQDDGMNTGIKVERNKGSIFAKDYEIERRLDQVTHDDLRTPMNQQVPDQQQTPYDQVAEQLELKEEYDYNDDVAYLQKFGRA